MDETDINPAPAQGDEMFRGQIRWDDVTIQNEAAHFPQELRFDFTWLKTYTRDVCARDIDRMVDAFKKVGVFHDKTTWSKILRGLWQKNAKGHKRPSPISPENLMTAVDALRTGVRAEAIRGQVPFVTTTTSKGIFDYIDICRAPGRVNGFGVIVGPTGSQKTATFKEYRLQRNHGSTRWFEAPENGAMMEFVTRLSGDLSAQTASDKKKAHLLKALKPGITIIIDNCQDLFRQEKDDRQPAFSYLRRLQDETGCTFILSFTPTGIHMVQKATAYWEQFEGRSGGSRKWHRLPDFAPEADVLQIAAAFGLVSAVEHLERLPKITGRTDDERETDPLALAKLKPAAKQDLKALVKISQEPGRIRRLFEDLQDAKLRAGSEALTLDHVKEARGEL